MGCGSSKSNDVSDPSPAADVVASEQEDGEQVAPSTTCPPCHNEAVRAQRASSLITSVKEQRNVFRPFLELVTAAFEADVAVFFIVDAKQAFLAGVHHVHGADSIVPSSAVSIPRAHFLPEVLLSGVHGELIILNMQQFFAYDGSAKEKYETYFGQASFFAALPVQTADDCIVGVLAIADRAPRAHFEDESMRALANFAEMLAVQLDSVVVAYNEGLTDSAVDSSPADARMSQDGDKGQAAAERADSQLSREGSSIDDIDIFANDGERWVEKDQATTLEELEHLPWALAWSEKFPRPPVTKDDKERVQTLVDYDLVDTADEQFFDRFCEYAASLFGASISIVSLLSDDIQFFKGRCGLAVQTTDRSVAVCNYTVKKAAPFVVLDLLKYPEFAQNPVVNGQLLNLRFYAGVPLTNAAGYTLGTFCVMDVVPRPAFSKEEVKLLEGLAMVVMRQLELRRLRIQQLKTALEHIQQCVPPGTKEFPPESYAAFVAINIAGDLQASEPSLQGMQDEIRQFILACAGYEVNSSAGNALFAFHVAADAVTFAMLLHWQMRDRGDSWPGLNIGIHVGSVEYRTLNPTTNRFRYHGKVVDVAQALAQTSDAASRAGRILVCATVWRILFAAKPQFQDELRRKFGEASPRANFPAFVHLGQHGFESFPESISVFALLPRPLPCEPSCSFADVDAIRDSQGFSLKSLRQIGDSMMSAPRCHPILVAACVGYWREIASVIRDQRIVLDALQAVTDVVNMQLSEFRGYLFGSEPGVFHIAFHSALDAADWFMAVHNALAAVPWSAELLACPLCQPLQDATSGAHLPGGLQLAVAASFRPDVDVAVEPNFETGRVRYAGPPVDDVMVLSRACHPGQMLVNAGVASVVSKDCSDAASAFTVDHLGQYLLGNRRVLLDVWEVRPMTAGTARVRAFRELLHARAVAADSACKQQAEAMDTSTDEQPVGVDSHFLSQTVNTESGPTENGHC